MRISIPKEVVMQIMANYNCSEEEAAKAYLDGQERAGEAFQSFLDERFSSKKFSKKGIEVKTPIDRPLLLIHYRGDE